MLTLIRCPFHSCVTAVACKRNQSFCQKSRWQVTSKHAYTLDPTKSEWTDYAAVPAQCGNLFGNELKCNLSGSIQPQSSQLAEPQWTDPGIQISPSKKISQAGNERWNIQARKKTALHHTTPHHTILNVHTSPAERMSGFVVVVVFLSGGLDTKSPLPPPPPPR